MQLKLIHLPEEITCLGELRELGGIALIYIAKYNSTSPFPPPPVALPSQRTNLLKATIEEGEKEEEEKEALSYIEGRTWKKVGSMLLGLRWRGGEGHAARGKKGYMLVWGLPRRRRRFASIINA